MRLLPHWHRKLTHGYAAWCIYAHIVVNFMIDKVELLADFVPSWATAVLLVIALGVSLVKQETVSGPT